MKRTEEIAKLACPHCGGFYSRVLESDASPDGSSIQRTRLCLNSACHGRYVTAERICDHASKAQHTQNTHA